MDTVDGETVDVKRIKHVNVSVNCYAYTSSVTSSRPHL